MKNLFKVLAFAFVFLISLSCKDASREVVERQQNGTVRTVYSSDRTMATTYLSGTVTLAAGTYDVLDVAVGSVVTLANGVNFNQLLAHSGSATTVKVLSGSTINTYQKIEVQYGTLFDNKGTVYGGDVFVIGGLFTNYGSHYPVNVTLQNSGEYKSVFNGFMQASATIKLYRDAKMSFTGCGKVECNHLQAEGFVPYTGFHFLYGRGQFKANTAYIDNTSLAQDNTIIFCCPSVTFANLGSLGSATASCSATC